MLEQGVAFTLALKALGDFLGEDHLDAKKGHLRLILVNEFGQAHCKAFSGGLLANCAHRNLHRVFQLAKPVFDVALALNGLVQFDCFSGTTPVLVDGLDHSAIYTVEGDSANSIEHLLEIVLDLGRVSSNRQNLEEISV